MMMEPLSTPRRRVVNPFECDAHTHETESIVTPIAADVGLSGWPMWRLLGRQVTMMSKTATRLVRRSPLQKLTVDNATWIASPTVRSSLMAPFSQQRFHSARRNDASQKKYPPRIQEWIDRKSAVSMSVELSVEGATKAKEALLIHKEQILEDIAKEDPLWLEQVVKEIRNDVLVGTMSESVHDLTHGLMRWLRIQGNMAQVVEDLLLRLIDEEDAGSGRPVNRVLYSIAIDAWANESAVPNAPQRAEALLQLMQDRYTQSPSKRPRPRSSHVTQVMKAWSYSSLPHAPQRAEQLLQWMEDLSNKFPPDSRAYTSVIHAYAMHGKPYDAERILTMMEDRFKDDPETAVRPNVATYTAVIGAWANAEHQGGELAAHKAEAVRRRMEEWSKELQDEHLKPNAKLFKSLMQAWAKSYSPKQSEKVEELWKELNDLYSSLTEEERDELSNEVLLHAYNTRMEAWSRSDHPEKAEEILNEMLDRLSAGDKNAVAPSHLSWITLALGWARTGNVKRTENVLKRMHEMNCAGLTSTKLSVSVYNALLLAWRKSKDPLAAQKAQCLLDWMEEQAKNGMEELRPNETSYELVISTWRRGRQSGRRGKMVLVLLERMENYIKTHGVSNKAAACSAYAMALVTVARGGDNDTHLEVIKLLHRIEAVHKSGSMGPVLNNLCYHLAISACAWAQTRDGEELAEEILRRMEASTDPEFRPRKRSYEAVIGGWARSFKDEAPFRAQAIFKRLEECVLEPDSPYRPSNKGFNFLLAACVTSRAPESANIARDILEKMERRRKEGDKFIRPSTGIFKHIVDNEFDHRDTLSAAPIEEMIHRLELSTENVEETFLFDCYLYALTVWGWSSDVDAAARAEHLWDRMNESSHVSPSLSCLNSLLRAYTNVDMKDHKHRNVPHKADELLRKTEQGFSSGKIGWRPNSTSYDCAIEVWALSKLPAAPERAFRLLERMDAIYKKFGSDYVKPGESTYANVLLACALTPANSDASKLHHFNIAVRAFNHLRESGYCEPNRTIYNRLLMCAIYLAPDKSSRIKMTRHIFSLCCRTGHVDRRIFKHFWEVAPKKERLQLLGRDDDEVKLSDLPSEWTINAKQDGSRVI